MASKSLELAIEFKSTSKSGNKGIFTVQPLERGFGVTIGNALRRVLLTSIPGAAITHVKIDGVQHEFSTLTGVKEDVADIIMNLKSVRFKLMDNNPDKVNLSLKGKHIFTASDIQKASDQFEILNPDQYISEINTKGKMQFQYGRLDVSAKIPAGTGTWPAIWMLGSSIDSVGWPTCGEVDIMEHVGFDENNIHSSLHSNTLNHVIGNNPHQIHFVENLTDDFHLFSVEWSDASFIFSVDNQSFFTYSKSDNMNVYDWPFDDPFFLILNLAIGGTWGGQQGIDNTIFPSRFLVEYVRLYKRS